MARSLRLLPVVTLGALLLAVGCSSADSEDLGTSESRSAIIDDEGRTVLPNWATDEEAAIEAKATQPIARGDSAPPPAGFRIPAQYEPVSHVIMTWAGHNDVLRGIAQASAAAGAEVWMVGGPPTMAGVSAQRYKSVGIGFNSVWTRDYGPVGINETTNTVGIVDTTYRHFAVRTEDDAMSCRLASQLGVPCHSTSLILDGGNYMTDGKGNVFLTKRIYDWNRSMSAAKVNELLKSHLGATTIHAVDYAKAPNGEPADGTGHLDMFAKLLAPCKVIVAQTNDQPYKAVTDAAAAYFANLSCGAGNYEVTRVKGWARGRTWYTYTNSLMVNKAVVIPFYSSVPASENEEAKRTYERLLPGYTITGVLSESTIVQGGSIHCITKEIPAVVSR
jgi:agmatine deiminase